MVYDRGGDIKKPLQKEAKAFQGINNLEVKV